MATLWESQWLSVEREGDGDEFFAAADEVLVVASDDKGNVLLIEEPSPAFGERGLFLPGGAVEPAEASTRPSANCARRRATGRRGSNWWRACVPGRSICASPATSSGPPASIARRSSPTSHTGSFCVPCLSRPSAKRPCAAISGMRASWRRSPSASRILRMARVILIRHCEFWSRQPAPGYGRAAGSNSPLRRAGPDPGRGRCTVQGVRSEPGGRCFAARRPR